MTPKQKMIYQIIRHACGHMSKKELNTLLKCHTPEQKRSLSRRLSRMVKRGYLIKADRYATFKINRDFLKESV